MVFDEDSLKKSIVPILFKKVGLGTVQIGSGFVIAAMGRSALVVTASHVLEEAINRSKKNGKKEKPGR